MLSPWHWVLFVHVVTGLVLAGASVSAPLIRNAIRGAETMPELRRWLFFSRQVGRFNPPSALILLASGIYLGTVGWWRTGWFAVSIAVWIVNSALSVGVVKKTQTAIAGSDGLADARRIGANRAWDIADGILLANNVAMVWVMTAKPSLLESVAVVVVANAFAGSFILARKPVLVAKTE